MVKNAFGATVNDVVLALCAGALRNYLDARGEHPDGPLVAMVPISVRTDDQKGTHGNQVSIDADHASPPTSTIRLERLPRIHDGMSLAKEQQNAIGADTLQNWVEFAAPAVLRPGRPHSTRARRWPTAIGRCSTSRSRTCPGPPFPLYVGRRPDDGHAIPIGPIFDGGGLNMTVMSYMDSLDFGLLVCPELIPDPWQLADAHARSARAVEEGCGGEGREPEGRERRIQAADQRREEAGQDRGLTLPGVGGHHHDPVASMHLALAQLSSQFVGTYRARSSSDTTMYCTSYSRMISRRRSLVVDGRKNSSVAERRARTSSAASGFSQKSELTSLPPNAGRYTDGVSVLRTMASSNPLPSGS